MKEPTEYLNAKFIYLSQNSMIILIQPRLEISNTAHFKKIRCQTFCIFMLSEIHNLKYCLIFYLVVLNTFRKAKL